MKTVSYLLLSGAFLTLFSPSLQALETQFDFSLGYRIDQLGYNIAGPNNTPNVLSELTWSDLNIAMLKLHSTYPLNDRLVILTDLATGLINSGNGQDSDYLANNRNEEFSRSYSDVSGRVLDLSVGFGLPIELNSGAATVWSLLPQAGLSINQQNLKLTNGVQDIPVQVPFDGLNSSYDAAWQGPWLGLGISGLGDSGTIYSLGFRQHFPSFKAKANWNLREDFQHPVSYTHTGKGQGSSIRAALHFHLSHDWRLLVAGNYERWSVTNGSGAVFLADGSYGRINLNEVYWGSHSFELGLQYYY